MGTTQDNKPERRQRQKHGHGEGTIGRRTDGRWQARLTLPGGRRKSFYGRTRQEVQQKLAKARYELEERGVEPADERTTVGQWLGTWLAQVRDAVSPGTHEMYARLVRLHVAPQIGRVKLARLTAAHVQSCYAHLLSDGGRGGAGLSPATVRVVHVVLHHALRDAVRQGVTQRNVAEVVRAPRARNREMAALTKEQARRLLETSAAEGDRLAALWTVALATGMRIGELTALRWRDVDLTRGTLSVRATLRTTRGGFELKEPKTKSSRRQIRLGPSTVAALRAHKTAQAQERLVLGAAWRDLGLVFCREDGYYLRPTSAHRMLHALCRRAGLPQIRVHDLRHTAATLLLGAGEHMKKVSEMLGHTSVSITMDRYSHVQPDMQESLADAMDRLLFG